MSNKSNGKTITVAEAAERFNVNKRTINRWVHAGYFPNAYKLSPGLRAPFMIPEADIIAFEKRQHDIMRSK